MATNDDSFADRGTGLIQLDVVILLATPVLRVAFSSLRSACSATHFTSW